ncbi:MAG TPA: MFS transporter [Caulobacterales bacterium]|nr:MFS transporter [Caulobacterales bacterium]
MSGTFRSLAIHNYRTWAAGAIVSNIGTWMQRTAQDWLVLAELTNHNATAVGIVTGLQFGPQLLLLPVTGHVADHFDRRRLLFITQASMGVLALGLGLLTVLGVAQLWHVYVFAFLLGCAAAFDAPARQSFVSELVHEAHLSNAVALNSASFNAARMVGPALAGVLIAGMGVGWVFILNAISFAAVLMSLSRLRLDELHPRTHAPQGARNLIAGFQYVLKRPDLLLVLFVLFVVGTFAINFPIFISTMAVSVFRVGASQFGLLTSMMAIGSVAGALLAARREHPSLNIIIAGAGAMGFGLALAAIAPTYILFGLALVIVGLAAQTLTATSLGKVQLSTDAFMRGRVMAILMAVTLGGTPIGAPIMGWIADAFGPRWAVAAGAGSCFIAAGAAVLFLSRRSAATAAQPR